MSRKILEEFPAHTEHLLKPGDIVLAPPARAQLHRMAPSPPGQVRQVREALSGVQHDLEDSGAAIETQGLSPWLYCPSYVMQRPFTAEPALRLLCAFYELMDPERPDQVELQTQLRVFNGQGCR